MLEVNESLIKHAIEQANASMSFEELPTSIIELLKLEQELASSNLAKEKVYEQRSLFN